MKVSQILEKKGRDYHNTEPERPLLEAVAKMMQHRIGSLLVLEGDRLVSIITERDVMWAVNEYGADLKDVKVSSLMAKKLVTCNGDCTVTDAMDLMTKNVTGRRIRHLPVLEDDQIQGVISIGDIVNILLQETEFENKLLKTYIKHWPEDEAGESPD